MMARGVKGTKRAWFAFVQTDVAFAQRCAKMMMAPMMMLRGCRFCGYDAEEEEDATKPLK